MSRIGETALAAGLAGLCILPSAAANVLPHIAAAWADGAVNPAEATTAIFQFVSVLAMAAMPFAVRNLREFSLKATCWLLAVLLFSLNLLNALDAAGAAREFATGGARGTIAKAAGLKSRLSSLRKSRSQVPRFIPTSAAQAAAARAAVTAAETARDTECSRGVGPNCRRRVSEVTGAAERLAAILTQRALTERAEGLDHEIAAVERQILDLGPVPEHADATAERVARILSAVAPAGPDDVTEWRPVMLAFAIELLAMAGPIGMAAAVRGAPGAPTPVEAPTVETPAPAKARKPRKPKAETPAPAAPGNVREWHGSETAPAPGSAVRVRHAYRAYSDWCAGKGRAPVSLTAFGKTMKTEIGIGYIERSKRGYYENIALTGAGCEIQPNTIPN